MGQKFFWTSFSTSEYSAQRHYFATSVASQFEPSGKSNNKVQAIHYYSWRINWRALCWRKKLTSIDDLFIFKLSCDPVFINKAFKNLPKFNCQWFSVEDTHFFSCVFLSLGGLYNSFIFQTGHKCRMHQEYTNVQTSRKECVNTVLLKHSLARHTGQPYKRWFLCWVCSKIQVAQYHALSHTQRQIVQDGGNSYWYSITLPASSHLQLPGPDIIFTYHRSQWIFLARIYLLLKQCTL